MSFDDIIRFWFDEIERKSWWRKDPQFDALIHERFGPVHASAARGELFSWRGSALGRLAEIIVLDQFSRNLFRADARAFAYDGMALVLAQEAVRAEVDQRLSGEQVAFLYMPYMHSESLSIHDQAVALFSKQGLEGNLEFERKHRLIVERFGRYPHRNAILGRTSTEAEEAFLKEPGSSF